MKSILMSIRPEWVAKILNGEKTIEIRKRFPKDYVGWVYIYVTKQGILAKIKNVWRYIKGKNYNPYFGYQGKVVARFWCDKVGKISNYPYGYEMYLSGSILTRDIKVMKENEICEKACLTKQELRKYIPCDKERTGYAIHITKLEIFDKPKEISEFYKCEYIETTTIFDKEKVFKPYLPLTRAPQSWCYVEVDYEKED